MDIFGGIIWLPHLPTFPVQSLGREFTSSRSTAFTVKQARCLRGLGRRDLTCMKHLMCVRHLVVWLHNDDLTCPLEMLSAARTVEPAFLGLASRQRVSPRRAQGRGQLVQPTVAWVGPRVPLLFLLLFPPSNWAAPAPGSREGAEGRVAPLLIRNANSLPGVDPHSRVFGPMAMPAGREAGKRKEWVQEQWDSPW